MTGWLIDKSALARLGQSVDGKEWAERINRGMLSICSVTRLEVGYSARSAEDLRSIANTPPVTGMVIEYFTPAMEERALAVQLALAERGLHRAPSLADLLIAAVAEIRKLTVLHFDKDFDLITEITGQPSEWLRV